MSFFYYGAPLSVNFCFIFMLLDLKQRGFMVIKILKRITDFCSLKAPEGTTRNNRKAGFTIIELMVVIIIINLLSGVAIPKVTDLIEKSREKTDLLKLYYLRDALERAMYENDALNVSEGNHGNCKNVSSTTLSNYLESDLGVGLFIIEFHNTAEPNYQGTHGKAQTQNMCGLMYDGGIWTSAMREAGFGAVADIVQDRANGNSFNRKSKTYSMSKLEFFKSNGQKESWDRTYPTNPIFKSKILSGKDSKVVDNKQGRLVMKARWAGGNSQSHSIEIFFAGDGCGSNGALLSRLGTCFSTRGDAGCSESCGISYAY